MAFDPFKNAAEVYASRGMPGLEEIEAPVFIYQADKSMAYKLGLQAVEGTEELPMVGLGLMPTFKPVTRYHLNAFTLRPVRQEDLTLSEQLALSLLTDMGSALIELALTAEGLKPQFGMAISRYGRQAPTAHTHIAARFQMTDAVNWDNGGVVPAELSDRQEVAELIGKHLDPTRMRMMAETISDVMIRTALMPSPKQIFSYTG